MMSLPVRFPLATTPNAAVPQASNNYSDLNGLAALKKDPKSPAALHAVAQQIDALFLQMMLKSMRDASAEIGESASNEMGMYQDMFDKQISLSMSQHQTIGLGAQLTRQLAAAAGTSDSLSGAPPARSARPVPVADLDAHSFVEQVYPAIQRAARSLGVDPLAIMAQAALETGWGKRMPHGADGTSSFNLFGIKADEHWSGPRVAADTVEYRGGVVTQSRTAFRAYGSIEDSVEDFARLLATSPRYREAVEGGANARSYIAGIGRSGYASDPQYANKLSDLLDSSLFRSLVSNKHGISES